MLWCYISINISVVAPCLWHGLVWLWKLCKRKQRPEGGGGGELLTEGEEGHGSKKKKAKAKAFPPQCTAVTLVLSPPLRRLTGSNKQQLTNEPHHNKSQHSDDITAGIVILSFYSLYLLRHEIKKEKYFLFYKKKTKNPKHICVLCVCVALCKVEVVQKETCVTPHTQAHSPR